MVFAGPLPDLTAQVQAPFMFEVGARAGMLVEQAAESFLLWHAVRPETEAVYAELRNRNDALVTAD